MKRKLVALLSIILLIGVAGIISTVSAQPPSPIEVIVDMGENWGYWTYEDSISDPSLECWKTYYWGIRNYKEGESLDNPIISVETDPSLVFDPWPEPEIMGPQIYEWQYGSIPYGLWWGVGGTSLDTTSVTPGFVVERTVIPEESSPPKEQVVVVTLDVDQVPPGTNELSVIIGFYPTVYYEEILLNYELTDWSNDAGWDEFQHGPSSIQFYTFDPTEFIGEFHFTATFWVTGDPSLMGHPVSKPYIEAFWRKVSMDWGTSTPPHIFEESADEWSATISFQLEQNINWRLVKTESPALFVNMAPITSPILYDENDVPYTLDTLKFTLASGAELHVYDPAGRHTCDGVNQIPGSIFEWDGDIQIVTVPDPIPGDYKTELVGTEDTPSLYELSIEASSGAEILYMETYSDEITSGQTHGFSTPIPSVGEEVSTYLYHSDNWVILEDETLVIDHLFAPDKGIIIGADEIKFDLNGHTIMGDGTSDNILWSGVFLGHPSTPPVTGVTVTDTCGGGEICNFRNGIGFWGSDGNSIDGVDIHHNIDGIYMWFSSENTIVDNHIHENERHGIKIFGIPQKPARMNVITNNFITDNQNGVFMDGGYTNENSILANELSYNVNGIRLWHLAQISPGGYEDIGAPNNNVIEGNYIHHNTIGIDIEVSPVTSTPRDVTGNSIRFNNFDENMMYGIRTDALVDARRNWWGSSQGPTVKGSKRPKGDSISLFVLFAPWLRSPA